MELSGCFMKTESTKRRARRAALFVSAALLAGCGGGGTSTFTPSSGVPASFAISATPSSVSISANTTAQIQLQLFPISGFSGTASVSISGLPAGVTTSPVSPFLLSTAQTLTLTAGAGVTNGTYALGFNATSGSLSSNTSASLQIEPLATFSLSSMASNLIVRQGGSTSAIFNITDSASGYTSFDVDLSVSGLSPGVTASFSQNPLPGANSQQSFTLSANPNATLVSNGTGQLVATRRTDGATSSYTFNFEIAPPPGVLAGNRTNFVATEDTPSSMVYDPVHQYIYAALPNRSRVAVISPATGQVLTMVPVPDAFGLSLTPDGRRVLSTGRLAARVAWIDTATQRIAEQDILPLLQPNCPCNPQTVMAATPLVMANGKVLFVGSGTVPSGVLEWDPAAGQVTQPQSAFGTIGARSADGSKAILADSETAFAGGIVLYDSASDSVVASRSFSDTTFAVAANPNGTQFVVAVNGEGIYFLDTQFNTLGVAPVGGLTTGLMYSSDGRSLYIVSEPNNVPLISTIDATTYQITGQAPAYATNIAYFERYPPLLIEAPMAADSTGMVFGAGDHGVALDDSTNFQNFSANAQAPVWTIITTPAEGPQNGSTPVTISTQFFNWIPDVWFGNLRGTNLMLNSFQQAQATAPPSPSPGPVNVKLISPDGTEGNIPQGFTYGAVAVNNPILAAPPSGGVTAELFGYGFGSDMNGQPSTVQFGSQSSSVTFSDLFPAEAEYPFPLEDIRTLVPAGAPGPVDIRVTSESGTAVIPGGLHYVQSVKDYASPDTLQFPLYDPKRQYVYLSAGTHIDVFSVGARQFLPSITPPTLNGQIQLVGLALTPDNSMLLAANAADGSVALIDPDNPQSAKAVEILPSYGYAQPSYITTTSTGLAFITTENINPEAGIALQLYQLDLATLNVTISSQANSTMVSSRDGSIVYAYTGFSSAVWTAATGTWSNGHGTGGYLGDNAMSGDGNVLAVSGQGSGPTFGLDVVFMDPATDILSRTGTSEFAGSSRAPVVGLRLNDAGSLAYMPVVFGTSSESVSFTENAIDIFDVGHSELRERVILSEQFTSPGTIAMTMDPAGQNIFLITTAGLTVVTLDAVPLSIGSVTPGAGASGATVTIRGSGFTPTTTVSFGGATSSATFVDEDTLQAVIPGSLPSGALSITVANPSGLSQSNHY